jgi:hypothetical protein
MSKSKRLGSIYANNRKRRIVSDDESEKDNGHDQHTINHQQNTYRPGHNCLPGDGRVDQVARCDGLYFLPNQHSRQCPFIAIGRALFVDKSH